MFAGVESDRSEFVDLDVPAWAKIALSRWYHLNTYVSLAIIITMLIAAVVFSMHRSKQLRAPLPGPPPTTNTGSTNE